jgi:hypothetical protein
LSPWSSFCTHSFFKNLVQEKPKVGLQTR